MRHRVYIAVAVLTVALGGATALLRFGPATTTGRSLIASLVTGVGLGDLGRLSVTGIGGDPWSDFTIDRVELVDARGAWLSARSISVSWRPTELWRRRLHIVAVSAGTVTVLRPPQPAPSRGPAGGSARSPLSARIDALSARVILKPGFASRLGEYQARAALDFKRNFGIAGRLSALSLGHRGDYLRIGFNVSPKVIALEAHAREADGGAIAGSLGFDANKPFLLDARAHGSRQTGAFSLSTEVGALRPAEASGKWSRSGANGSAHLDLVASRWLAPWRAGVGSSAVVQVVARKSTGDLYRVDLRARADNLAAGAVGDVDVIRWRSGSAGLAVNAQVANVSALVGAPGLGAAKLSARLSGEPGDWRLAGDSELDRVATAGIALTRVRAPFEITCGRGGVVARARASAVGSPGTGLTQTLLGLNPTAAAELDWLPGGRVLWRQLSVHGTAIDIAGQGGVGLFGQASFSGTAKVKGLSAVAAGAEGAIDADWRATQARDTAPWTFGLRARGAGVRLPAPEARTLLGASPTLGVDGQAAKEGVTISRLAFKGGAGDIDASGVVGARGALRFKLGWSGHGPLDVGPLSLSGPSDGEGELTGSVDRPRLDMTFGVKTLQAPDLPALRLDAVKLTVNMQADGAALTGGLALSGRGDHGPARAIADVRMQGPDLNLTNLDVELGGATAKGLASLRGATLAEADLSVALGPGDFVSQGHLTALIHVATGADGPNARLSGQGSGLVFDGGDVESFKLSAEGPVSRLSYRLEAIGGAPDLRGRVAGSGVFTDAKGGSTLTFAGDGRIGAADVHTLVPLEVTLRPTGPAGIMHLAVGEGRADVTLTQTGARLNGDAVLTGVSLALLEPGIRGQGDGALNFTAEGGALRGTARIGVTGLAEADLKSAHPMSGSANATFADGVIGVKLQLADGQGSRASADLKLPAVLSSAPWRIALDRDRPIAGRFSAAGEIGPLWDLVEGEGRTLSGRLTADGAIAGTLADPRFTGKASVENADFEDGAVGLRLRGLGLGATLEGDAIDVTRFTATDGSKGSVTGEGRISLVRGGASGFRVGLRGFRLIDNNLGQASATGAVTVDRAADGKVRLGGALTIDHAQIAPIAPTPSGVVPMDVVEIHRAGGGQTFAAPPPEREPPVALDIALTAPGGIFIKGRGLNLEMSLDARVTGSTADPSLSGVARVVRGDYDFAGQRFQVDDTGTVRLGSSPETIRLNLTATRDDPTLTAVIKIGGTAAAPTLSLSSTPVLPQDEVLSQVLFGASAAQLSPFQAAQLASAVAGLARGGGFDVIGGLRGFAHLDRLAIDSGATTGFAVSGGKYISDKVYVELSGGARAGEGAQVEWRLRKHLAIVSRVTSQGDHALSVRWRKDY